MKVPGPGIYKQVKDTAVFKSTGNITIGNSERKGLLIEASL